MPNLSDPNCPSCPKCTTALRDGKCPECGLDVELMVKGARTGATRLAGMIITGVDIEPPQPRDSIGLFHCGTFWVSKWLAKRTFSAPTAGDGLTAAPLGARSRDACDLAGLGVGDGVFSW